MTELIVALRNFATAPKKAFLLLSIKAGLTLWPVHFGREEKKEKKKEGKGSSFKRFSNYVPGEAVMSTYHIIFTS
jgi:hypothetical protein